MPSAPATRSPQPKSRPKPTSPRPSMTNHKSSSASRVTQRTQPVRPSARGASAQSRGSSSRNIARPPPRTTHHRSAPATHQHVHRHTTGGKAGPVYMVRCNRKHSDDGFYSRCQRILRRFVTWSH